MQPFGRPRCRREVSIKNMRMRTGNHLAHAKFQWIVHVSMVMNLYALEMAEHILAKFTAVCCGFGCIVFCIVSIQHIIFPVVCCVTLEHESFSFIELLNVQVLEYFKYLISKHYFK